MTLEGTIQSVQSSTTVTLDTPASATISPATFAYGTDNHVAFQAAVDAAGAAGGGQVSVPAATGCPANAICGYVLEATDQMKSKAPGAVKIRYNNVSLVGDVSPLGDPPQTNLFAAALMALIQIVRRFQVRRERFAGSVFQSAITAITAALTERVGSRFQCKDC